MDKDAVHQKNPKIWGGMHLVHWVIIGLSLILTLCAWYFSKTQIHEKNYLRFEKESAQIVKQITERMAKYEDALWSGVGLVNSHNGTVSHAQWLKFAKTLKIEDKYPGINGIGIIKLIDSENVSSEVSKLQSEQPNFRIHPQHDNATLLPIVYIEPIEINQEALGLDMAHEKNRYTAAIKARNTGQAQITGPIVLVQDSGKTPGFLFFAPYYSISNPDTESERIKTFQGMVYAPFVVKNLMAGTLAQEARHISIKLQDKQASIYDELQPENPKFDPSPLFTTSKVLNLYGRQWFLQMNSNVDFRIGAQHAQPAMILTGGIIIDILLVVLFTSLTRANRRANDIANQSTAELQFKAERLKKSNQELERFAYITSHDLRAPLRGIDNLVQWIEEDAYAELSEQTRDYFEKIKIRLRRMDNLITGILEYSKINFTQKSLETINTYKVLNEVSDMLSDDKNIDIALPANMPTVSGSEINYKQIFSNLLGNAIKYNDKERCQIEVNYRDLTSHHHFIVKDNGPGIEPQFHHKVFELFHTLQSKDDFESTGVGLSIVKKIIEQEGGHIWIQSEKGMGAEFNFIVPKVEVKNAQ